MIAHAFLHIASTPAAAALCVVCRYPTSQRCLWKLALCADVYAVKHHSICVRHAWSDPPMAS